MRISVALATYNGERYLQEQLDSYLVQTRLPDELIISDDSSTDGTLRILYDFAEMAPFDVVIMESDSNVGYGHNFRKALDAVTGDIVFLSDQDDVWFPGKIEKILGFFEEFPDVNLIAHDIEFCNEDLELVGQTKMGRMSKLADLQEDYVVGMASAVKKSFLNLCSYAPPGFNVPHDTWIHRCGYALQCKKLVYDVLAYHRRHDSNETGYKLLNAKMKLGVSKYLWLEFVHIFKDKPLLGSRDPSFLKWLEEKKAEIVQSGFFDTHGVDRLIEEEKNRIHIVQRRREILSQPRFRRLWPSIAMLISGEYRNFRGALSFMRDLLLK